MDLFDLNLWKKFSDSSFFVDQVSIDSRQISSTQSLFIALPGSTVDGHKFLKEAKNAGAKAAIVKNTYEPDFELEDLQLIFVEDPLLALQEIAACYRNQYKPKVVAIIGTHGKTMVKDLLQSILSHEKNVAVSPGSYNSQIGVPLSLFHINKDTEIALIEASFSEKGEMEKLSSIISADACIITHIGKKHLATLKDLQTVAEEMTCFIKSIKTDWSLVPHQEFINKHLSKSHSNIRVWNQASKDIPHANLLNNEISSNLPYQITFPDLTTFTGSVTAGFYYFLDLLNISIKAAWSLGVNSSSITKAIKNYSLEPMRYESFTSNYGVTFINDCYSYNSQSVINAIQHLSHSSENSRKIFIFGGIKENQKEQEFSYKQIAESILKQNIEILCFIGDANYYKNLQDQLKTKVSLFQFDNYKEAFSTLRPILKPNDSILFTGKKKLSLNEIIEGFEGSIPTNQCFINLAAIQSNIQMIRNKIPDFTRIMVMVKAFAYGTDEVKMAQFLSTCKIDILGVSYVDEAIVLKRAKVKQSIFVINAPIYEINKVVFWNLEVGVSDKSFIESLSKKATEEKKKIKVHLHVNTGMSRLGCRIEEALELAMLIQNSPSLIFEGIMTHFACAESPKEDDFTLGQIKLFDDVIALLKTHGIDPTWKHAANSSGSIRFHLPQYNMIRVGLAVYGLYSSDETKDLLDLKLALSLVSRIVGFNDCKKGDSISYGRSYRVEKEKEKVAVLPIGYFDGIHRNYSGKGSVMIRGQKAPMIGKICMDFMMIDVSLIPNVSIGDSVLIFGEDEYGQYLPPESVAKQGDSIIHELITCLGPRIQRVFINEESNSKNNR